MGTHLPKQFLPLGEKTVLEMCVDAFERSHEVDEVLIVSHPDHIGRVHQLVERNHWSKLTQVVPGGKERWQSSWAAIEACKGRDDEAILLLHDAARPFVDSEIIARCISAFERYNAVVVGVPATDTLWLLGEGGTVDAVPPRSQYYCAQTPQAFRLGLIRKAYALAQCDAQVLATDDCGILRHYLPHEPVGIVEGSPENKKITYPNDLKQ